MKAFVLCSVLTLTAFAAGEPTKPLLPKDSSYYGVWMTKGDGDVHVYTSMQDGIVIGTNVNLKDHIDFSDMALSVDAKGSAVFQYADEQGNPRIVNLTSEQWRGSILRMLRDVKSRVEGE